MTYDVALLPGDGIGPEVVREAVRDANAFVATGYAMLGMTLSQPAGEALAEFLATGERPAVLEPFRTDRFRRRLP